jgi:transcriptional antiterminator/mannitol/fructose-specific phosphotransferase system IIA component (Ntr-type)
MYVLTKRQIDIIKYILDCNRYVRIKELSDRFNVSSRTIRYDLDSIETWLNENKATLIRKTGKGINIIGNDSSLKLKQAIKFISPRHRILKQDERIRLMVLEILSSNDTLTTEELSQKLWTSQGTIVKDLDKMKKILSKYSINLIRKQGKGVYIEGNEEKIRKFIVDVFEDLLSVENIMNFFKTKKKNNLKMLSFIERYKNLFELNEIDSVFKVLNEAQRYMNFKLVDNAYVALSIHIIIAIKRIKNNQQIVLENSKLETFRDKKEYIIATYIAKRLEEIFHVRINEYEIGNITLHLMGAKIFEDIERLSTSEKIGIDIDTKIIRLAEKIIEEASKQSGINFENDIQLFNGLVLHLKPTIYRLENELNIKNPIIDQIKLKYPFIFQVAKSSVIAIEEYLGKPLPLDEVGYIAMHLGAAYERNYDKRYFAKALIICSSGMATSQLLSTRIKNLLPELQIVDTCSLYDVDKYKDEVHFIISTIDFELPDIEVITVSPFLEENDLLKIRKKLLGLLNFDKLIQFSSNNKLIDKEMTPMLKDLLTEESVELNVEARNWEEAIEKAGRVLLKNNLIKESYIKSMINAVHELGPYIVIMPGIAFAHARPDDNVIDNCLSLITLKKPIDFGNKENDPVSIVFAFGAKNSDGHLNALQDLANYLTKEENVEFLKNATDKSEVIKELIKY